jgi:IS30 family transposase
VAARPKTAKLAGNDELRDWVQAKLKDKWSPEQIEDPSAPAVIVRLWGFTE